MATNSDLASIGLTLDSTYKLILSGYTINNDEFSLIKSTNDLGIYNNSIIWPMYLTNTLSAIGGLSSLPSINFSRSTSATRVNSQGLLEYVPVNTPRFDFDPITLQPKGLLMEPLNYNILPNFSTPLANIGWNTALAIDINNADNILAPDGTTKNILKATITASGLRDVQISKLPGTAWNTNIGSYNFSIFVKLGVSLSGSSTFSLRWAGPACDTLGIGSAFQANYTLAGAGSVQNYTPTFVNATLGGIGSCHIQRYNNGWYRCTTTINIPSATPVDINNTANPLNAGRGYFFGVTMYDAVNPGDSFYLWGPQLEPISYGSQAPTSYIPTTNTLSSYRAGDLCYIANPVLSTFFNKDQGSWFTEFTIPQADIFNYNPIINTTDGGSFIQFEGSRRLFSGRSSGPVPNDTPLTSDVPIYPTVNSAGLLYNNIATTSLSGRTISINNILNPLSADNYTTAINLTSNNSQIFFGSVNDNSALNGHLRTIKYVNYQLPISYLQTLTTPALTSSAISAQIELNKYLARLGNTNSITKQSTTNLYNFIKGCFDLDVWDRMVCWPMIDSQNAGVGNIVYSLGGYGIYNGTLSYNSNYSTNKPTWTSDGLYNADYGGYVNVKDIFISNTPFTMFCCVKNVSNYTSQNGKYMQRFYNSLASNYLVGIGMAADGDNFYFDSPTRVYQGYPTLGLDSASNIGNVKCLAVTKNSTVTNLSFRYINGYAVRTTTINTVPLSYYNTLLLNAQSPNWAYSMQALFYTYTPAVAQQNFYNLYKTTLGSSFNLP
jgi:hypothetical protein